MHRAAMLWMRVTNDGATLECPFAWTLDYCFQATGWPINKELFCHRVCGHGVSKVDRFVNTAVKL